MAFINLRNAVVDRLFWGDKGVSVHEEFTKGDGTQGRGPSYSLFFDEAPGLAVGTKLKSAKGQFSHKSKIGYAKDDTNMETPLPFVDFAINSPEYELAEDQGGSTEDTPW